MVAEARKDVEPRFSTIDNHVEHITPFRHRRPQTLEVRGTRGKNNFIVNKIVDVPEYGNRQTVNGEGPNVGTLRLDIPDQAIFHNTEQSRTQRISTQLRRALSDNRLGSFLKAD
jgi:hypothetical protein